MSKIRVKHGEDEIDLEGSESFIEAHLEAFYKKIDRMPAMRIREQILSPTQISSSVAKQQTPAEFYKAKKKTDGISQIIIFGKYLEQYKGQSDFSREEINEVVKLAKLPRDVHSQYFTNAVKQGLLRQHSKGRYSLTLSAESTLSSM